MDIERRLYLRLFSFCIGRAMEILSYFIDTCVLGHSDFDSFLNLLKNRHKLFHKWLSKTPCCECINSVSIAAPNKGSVLNEAQLKTIYKLDGTEVAGHVITNSKGHTIQHCLCKVTAIAGITTENLDIALVHCLLKTCDPVAFSKVGMHIEVIRRVRNELAHHSHRGIMTEFDFNSKWDDVEKSVLAIAKEVNPSWERLARKLITPLKNADVNLKDILEKINGLEDSMRKTMTDILQGHKRIDELLILGALDKQKNDLYILIKQLLFEVNLKGIKAESTTDVVESCSRKEEYMTCPHVSDGESQQQQSSEKKNLKVMWRLETPDAWDVERMKQKLEKVAELLSPEFCVEFIYAGSLVIQTSVSRHILRDRQLLKSAIQSFLEKIVEVCEINTDIKQTVAVEFNVVNMDLSMEETVKSAFDALVNLPKFSQMKLTPEEDQVRCKHCNQHFTCDQCSDRRKQNLVLEEENKRMVETIADMKMELLKLESEDTGYHRLLQKPKYIEDTEQGDMKMELLKLESEDIDYHRLLQKQKYKDDIELGATPIEPKMVEDDFISLWKTARSEEPIEEDTKSPANKLCTTCNSEPSVYWCFECNTSLCENCNSKHRKSVKHHVQHVQDKYTLDYTFNVNVSFIRDIKLVSDGLLCVADFDGRQLVTVDITSSKQQSIPLPGKPYYITVVDDSTVAVALFLGTKVVIVDVRQSHIIKHIDVKVQCYGIMYSNNQLFVGCMDATIKVLSMSGKITNTIQLSFIPWYICGSDDGSIYCTDRFKLYCIDTEGNILFTFTHPDMDNPWSITTDDTGHVLVVCYRSNNILSISPDGKQCQVIVKHIPYNNCFPYMCYSPQSKSLVVGSFDTIDVYKLWNVD